MVTRWRSRLSPSSASDTPRPAAGRTTRAPFASAPQSSRVAASKEMEASWKKTSPEPRSAKSVSRTSRTTARWGTATPFGLPVVPEVYIT